MHVSQSLTGKERCFRYFFVGNVNTTARGDWHSPAEYMMVCRVTMATIETMQEPILLSEFHEWNTFSPAENRAINEEKMMVCIFLYLKLGQDWNINKNN